MRVDAAQPDEGKSMISAANSSPAFDGVIGTRAAGALLRAPARALLRAPARALLRAPVGDGFSGRELWMNYGGPMTRTQRARIQSSLLGESDPVIRCPLRLEVALDFGNDDPRRCVMDLLAARGLEDAEELRALFLEIPRSPMLCRLNSRLQPRLVADSDPDDVLRDALILGLCTSVFFDPSRPVLWTSASLTRRLEIFDTRGFYA